MWPVVRLKPACLEMRGADCGPWPLICALPALWVGLLYDPLAQQQALELVQGWSQEERDYLREEVRSSGWEEVGDASWTPEALALLWETA